MLVCVNITSIKPVAQTFGKALRDLSLNFILKQTSSTDILVCVNITSIKPVAQTFRRALRDLSMLIKYQQNQ
jgi:hypothetical protein